MCFGKIPSKFRVREKVGICLKKMLYQRQLLAI